MCASVAGRRGLPKIQSIPIEKLQMMVELKQHISAVYESILAVTLLQVSEN